MSGPVGETGGGVEHAGAPVAAVLDPVLVRQQEFAGTLVACAEAWAPGRGVAPWDQWANLRADSDTPRSTMPRPVRIGINPETHMPVLVPTLADGHLLLGDPALARPVRPRSMAGIPMNEQRQAKIRFEEQARVENQNRQRRLAQEAGIAGKIARNLVVRTAAVMAPGSLKVTVLDAHGTGAFEDMQPDENKGLVTIAAPGSLHEVLQGLRIGITQANNKWLPPGMSMRDLLERGDNLPTPWQLVVILGRGNGLDEYEREALVDVMQRGPAAGVSLILHGLDIKPPENVYPISWDAQRRLWHTGANGDIPFRMDAPAPRPHASDTAKRALRQGPYTPWRPEGHGRWPQAQRYRNLVTRAVGNIAGAEAERADFRQRYAFSTPEMLTATAEGEEAYLQTANQVVANPNQLSGLVRTAFGPDGTLLQRGHAWALLQLVQELPGMTVGTLTRTRFGMAAKAFLAQHSEALPQAVAVTQHHGQHLLPERMETYIAQYLPQEPPSWAFLLTADAAFAGRMARQPHQQQARAAIALHLESTYGLEPLLDDRGNFADPALSAALAECELMHLYDMSRAEPALQLALARRAEDRLALVDRETLPAGAQITYDLALKRLQEARDAALQARTQRRARVSGWVGAAGARRRKGDGENADSEAGAGPEGEAVDAVEEADLRESEKPRGTIGTDGIYRPNRQG
ncbi:MAG TPA: hypothetical protein VF466_02355 [Candidatus Saccharimonadales bacterium]